MVEQDSNNFILDSFDLTIQEKYKLLLEKEMLYNELEFNPQYDEYISFNHYFSVYQKFDCEIDKVEHFPFLVQCEYLNSSFLRKKPLQDPLKASPASIIGRVKQFSGSKDDSFKKNFLENIKVYSEIIGIQTTSFLLIPGLAKIVEDTISIKNKFLSVLPTYIDYLYTKEDIGYEIIKTNILNIIEELYHPDSFIMNDQETKTFLFDSLIKIGKIISNRDKEIILKVILSFANEETQEPLKTERKFLCIRAIDKLAEVLGTEICDNYFIPQLYSFSFELDSFMRMEVLNTLPSVAQEATFSLITTKIYEILQTMSKDTAYKVRKVCVETLPKIIKINKERSLKTHLNSKNSLFIDLIDILIYDNNKEVRLTVLERIGEIIHQLTREELSLKLFDFYRNSIEEYYFNIRNSEVEGRYNSTGLMEKMVYYFAYNFPAVLYCYGAESWPQLKKIYKNLCEEKEKTIKRSIISSFHEVATIIGKEKTESDLLPIYDKYLQSTDKNEKNLAMRNLPKILQVVSREIKETYFKYFEAMSLFKDNDNNVRKFNFVNWKNKLDVVESILCYYNLYEYDIIYKQIIPPCLSFCLDEVYLVRKTSARVLANIVSYLYICNYQKDKLINIIHSFAFNANIQLRVIFIKMCKVFFNYYVIFKEIICDILYILLKDKLVDVKISLAKLLSKIISNDKAFLFKDKEIHRMCLLLVNNESSQTIQSYLQNKNIIEFDDKELIENRSNDISGNPPVFRHNMNSLIIEFKLQIPLEDEKSNETVMKKRKQTNDINSSFGKEDEEEAKEEESRIDPLLIENEIPDKNELNEIKEIDKIESKGEHQKEETVSIEEKKLIEKLMQDNNIISRSINQESIEMISDENEFSIKNNKEKELTEENDYENNIKIEGISKSNELETLEFTNERENDECNNQKLNPEIIKLPMLNNNFNEDAKEKEIETISSDNHIIPIRKESNGKQDSGIREHDDENAINENLIGNAISDEYQKPNEDDILLDQDKENGNLKEEELKITDAIIKENETNKKQNLELDSLDNNILNKEIGDLNKQNEKENEELNKISHETTSEVVSEIDQLNENENPQDKNTEQQVDIEKREKRKKKRKNKNKE